MRLQWIEENAPHLSQISAGPLVLAASGQHATRSIGARNTDDEEVHGEVEYDVPPANGESASAAKLRREMHWQREVTVIRALDGAAADEHRAKRAKQRHHEREQEADVAAVLERVIAKVERDAYLAANRWRCPGGCSPDDPKRARAAFRVRCIPLWLSNQDWDQEHDPRVYSSLSGREVGSSSTISTYSRGLAATEAERRAAHQISRWTKMGSKNFY